MVGGPTLFGVSGISAACGPVKAMRSPDTGFNTPAEMWARLVFVSRYLFFLGGLVLSASALLDGSGTDALKALVFFAAMIAGHQWLKSRGKLADCERAFDAMFSGTGFPDEDDGLQNLLARRAALEEKRGTPGFDPWEVQAVRREISDYVRQHPELNRDLDEWR